jgi:peptidyl-prolyl cis-trans isomerase C
VICLLAPALTAQAPLASHVSAGTGRSAGREVARVNGVALGPDRLDAALRGLLPLESFHRNVSPDRVAALRSQALQDVINEELQYQEGVRLRLVATEADVNAAIARIASAYKSRQALEDARRKSGVSADAFRAELRRLLTIGHAVERNVTRQCQVSADDTARFYIENPARFVVPEQLRLQVITIGVEPGSPAATWTAAQTKARDVLRQLRAGAAFEKLAATHSTDPSRKTGGDMGFVHRGSLSDEFEKAAAAMKPGDVSEVVSSLFGFHIVRLTAIKPPERKPLASVADELRRDLTTKRCVATREQWIAALRGRATIITPAPTVRTAATGPRVPGRER